MTPKTRKFNIIIIFIVVIMLIAVLTTSAYAIWQMTPDAAVKFEMLVGNENPSEKYQIYVPVDVNGERIAGTLTIKEYAYTHTEDVPYTYNLDNAGDAANIVGLALVGWNGGIAVNNIEINELVSDTMYAISDFTMPVDGLAVTQIIIDAEFRNYYFKGNEIIKKISIPKSVVRIDAGLFSCMPYLENVIILGSSTDTAISIGQGAFDYCPNLPGISATEGREMVVDEL
ncbi:MAG: leucine-rich repeat protein [Clostridia bacterium]